MSATDVYPDTVAGLSLPKVNGSVAVGRFDNKCEKGAVAYCYDSEIRNYISSDTNKPSGFSIATLKLTSGNVGQLKEQVISSAQVVTISGKKVYVSVNGSGYEVRWFPDGKTVDMIYLKYVPTSRTSPDVQQRLNEIVSTFLPLFPPASE